ncbi:glycosyltransferase [Candidatus Saccharibacteria bacterium]|nr:glycosyltransferase [Candidatus Saccharibacteria bacterium]
MRVALVCDWLTNVGGAEKVLLEIHRLYPKAPIYTSQYSPKGIDWFTDADVRTGWLQIFPVFMRRLLSPLRQQWFKHLNLSEYDLIISVTGAEAKAVKSGKWLHEHGKKSANPKGIHISYCHVPTQYYWQMYNDYVENPGFGILNPVVRFFFKLMVGPLRRGDYKAAQVPDYYVTISEYAKELIGEYYEREAVVIHPPVEVDEFKTNDAHILSRAASPRPVDLSGRPSGVASTRKASFPSARLLLRSATGEARSSSPCQAPEALRKDIERHSPYYIVTSRQVNWKRIDLAVKACMKLRRKLLVVGEGSEHNKLVKMSNGSEWVKFVPLVGKRELAELLRGAKGFLFPSFEPFGIAPVEALATGCPVIAFGEGGAQDYVVDGENGVLFPRQTVKSLSDAIVRFEK